MKTIQVERCHFCNFEDSDEVFNVDAPDSLELRNLNLYLCSIDGKKHRMFGLQFDALIELLFRAEDNGYNINDLLKIAASAGNKQVVYEHHLRSARE